ncbi:MAG: hypothetical protein DRN68_02530 [Thaumarchaeota archaeon]|nr:MAG: hypothetical protein DRN68_02530 [Nitrososphaerota archaeon]
MTAKIIEKTSLREKLKIYKDRTHAAKVLADMLEDLIDKYTCLAAIPNGGVPIGLTIAGMLNIDLGLMIIARLLIPWEKMRGFGALSSDGVIEINWENVRRFNIAQEIIDEQLRSARNKIDEMLRRFGSRIADISRYKTIVLIDDGIASGYTMLASIKSIRRRWNGRIVSATPTGFKRGINLLKDIADIILCPNIKSTIHIRDAYINFPELDYSQTEKILREFKKAYPSLFIGCV